MTREQAQRILLLYRPGRTDADDPEVAEALECARRDAELGQWLEQHSAFQVAMRSKLREVPIPPDLKDKILAQRKIVRPAIWWKNPAWLAAAAALVLCAGLAAWFLTPRVPDHFADYRSRMVRAALREYRMDIVTNDMRQVREFFASHHAPANYAVPAGLQRLPLTGAGLLRWRNHPVSMVCFERGNQQMLFLFVLKRSAVEDPPPATPKMSQVKKFTTASWSQGDKTYILAGPPEPDFAQKYL